MLISKNISRISTLEEVNKSPVMFTVISKVKLSFGH